MGLTSEQQKVLEFNKQNLIISASAGSGKTFILIKYITDLIISKKVPLKRFLVLTFTKAAANEIKERLLKSFLKEKTSDFLFEQIDEIPTSDIKTIDAFCEKIIKQNISKTSLDENFSIIDEKQSQNLKEKAFERAFEEFSENYTNEFGEVFFAFKKNKGMIFDCVNQIKNFFDSQEDEQYLFDYFLNNNEKLFDDSCKYLNDFLRQDFNEIFQYATQFNSQEAELISYYNQLLDLLKTPLGEDYIENAKNIASFSLPRMTSKKIDEENKQVLKNASAKLKKIINLCKQYDFSQLSLKKQRMGVLNKAILLLVDLFAKNYHSMKKNRDFIDFADAEKIAQKMLADKEILEELQESYDYVFIDEYQDTNKLQESIIKPIAEKGMFVAVGDIKQGIYGFRNASMEIMQKDIEAFSKDNESETLFLKSNFRSDKNILDFVNTIFEKIMTKNSTGVDYFSTSMLKGEQDFAFDGEKPVKICLCRESEKDKAKFPKIYSVKQDLLSLNDSNQAESSLIVNQIEKFLNSNLFDVSTKSFRKVLPQDIAVLFRGRSKTMKQCYKLLLEKNIDVVTDSKNNLIDCTSIKIIISLLKLTLSTNDDIALVTVLHSPFCKFNLDELANISLAEGETFEEKIESLKNQNQKVCWFYQFLEDFKFNCQLKGVVKSLKEKINKSNFFENLPSDIEEKDEELSVEALYKLIKSINADFNVPLIIESVENSSIQNNFISQSNNSVLLTTIHATKGLEYPIVILAGCGDNFEKTDTNSFAISKRFGLGTNVYDNIMLTKSPTPILHAIRKENKKRHWIDEIMIFYVALTRAKNHLVLCGTFKEIETKKNLEDCNSYFDLAFTALGEKIAYELQTEGEYQDKNFDIEIFANDKKESLSTKKVLKEEVIDLEDIKEKIALKYNFNNFELKNSVTSINENAKSFAYGETNGADRTESIERGNLLHLAMKFLDFDKICDKESLCAEIENYKDELVEISEEDKNLLLSNISKVKTLCRGGKIFKEKEFVMQISLKDIDEKYQDVNIIVQGAIDLFAVLDKEIILIDYKFTNTRSEEQMRQRYKKQIELYSKALSKAYPSKKINKYLLSLKFSKVINF